jgi:hypothetical protein
VWFAGATVYRKVAALATALLPSARHARTHGAGISALMEGMRRVERALIAGPETLVPETSLLTVGTTRGRISNINRGRGRLLLHIARMRRISLQNPWHYDDCTIMEHVLASLKDLRSPWLSNDQKLQICSNFHRATGHR